MRFALPFLAASALSAAGLAAVGPAGVAAAQTPTPSPRVQALAREIYEAVGGSTQMNAMADNMIKPLLASLPTQTPDGKDLRADLTAFLHAETVKISPQIEAGTLRVYAEMFSEAELQDILTFYRSPTGRSFATRLPEFGARVGVVLAPILRQEQADIFGHICDLRNCTPEQRAQIAKLAGG